MAYEIRERSGSLFPNTDRQSEASPNATGKALIGGQMYRIAAWKKESASGVFYMTLKFTAEERRVADEQERLDLDDAIPF